MSRTTIHGLAISTSYEGPKRRRRNAPETPTFGLVEGRRLERQR